MKIRLANDSDQSAWDAFVLDHSEGLPYQLFAWKKAVELAYGFEGIYLMAENGGGVCGVFPLVQMKLPLRLGKLVSLPYCDAGGVLSNNSETTKALLNEARGLAVARKAGGLELRTALTLPEDVVEDISSFKKVSMVLQLPKGSQSLFSSLKPKLRSQVNKPKRDGLIARLGGLELVADFYQVFTENMRDLGSPVHSRKWIEAVVRFYGDRARVGVVYTPDGLPAAGGIILLHEKTVTVPWASSRRRLNKLNPNMLLYWTFLAFAADSGYARFDFGRSTPGEGTYRFKEQWGAFPVPLVWQIFNRDGSVENLKSNGSSASKKRMIVEALWQRLPAEICNKLGPMVRRHVAL